MMTLLLCMMRGNRELQLASWSPASELAIDWATIPPNAPLPTFFAKFQMPSKPGSIRELVESNEWRVKCGESARKHIHSVADREESTDRVEMAMRCAIEDRDNPLAEQDLAKAIQTAEYLDKHHWGQSLEESRLRGTDAKIRFLRWQRLLRNRMRC
jgi:hypothetical protein